MANEKLVEFLKKTLITLHIVAPGYDPLATHRATDNILGCSRFNENVVIMHDIYDLILNTERTEVTTKSMQESQLDDLLPAGLSEQDYEALKEALSEAKGVQTFPIWCPGIGLAIHTSVACGRQAWSAPIDGEKYTVKKSAHGDLQVYGKVREESCGVNVFCIILTIEKVADGSLQLALASAYPGLPDPNPDKEGLKEGDILTAQEVRNRRLRPKEEA